MAFGWLKKAAQSAGRGVSSVAKTAAKGGSAVSGLARKVPVVGKPLSATINIGVNPLKLTAAVVSGQNIKKAVYNNFKASVANIRDVAPFAKAILQQVPVLGPGANAAIAASLAIASGQSVTKALIDEVKRQVPGGVLGDAAFNVSVSVMADGSIPMASIAKLPPVAQAALKTVANGIKSGKIDKSSLEKAYKSLPPDVQKALNAGIALGNARRLQAEKAKAVAKVPPDQTLAKLRTVGKTEIAKVPAFKNQYTTLKSVNDRAGYEIGHGLMAHTATEQEITSIRNMLVKSQQPGFDMALSIRIGAMSGKQAPPGLTPQGRAAFYTTVGMADGDPNANAAQMKALAANPAAKEGAIAAIQTIPAKKKGFIQSIIDFFTGKK